MKRRGSEPRTDALSPELATLLVDGPSALDSARHQMPDHDELRRLWAVHGAALKQAHPRRRYLWFEDRDLLVRKVRGEP